MSIEEKYMLHEELRKVNSALKSLDKNSADYNTKHDELVLKKTELEKSLKEINFSH